MNQPTRPTVYDGGIFSAARVDNGQYQDLMGHLYTEFLDHRSNESLPTPKKGQYDFALAFLEFARNYLDRNPPRTQRYVGVGFAMELQNGTVVTFNTQDATEVAHRDESISVNKPRSQPGQHGISDVNSVPITTGHNQVPTNARTQVDVPPQAKNKLRRSRSPGGAAAKHAAK